MAAACGGLHTREGGHELRRVAVVPGERGEAPLQALEVVRTLLSAAGGALHGRWVAGRYGPVSHAAEAERRGPHRSRASLWCGRRVPRRPPAAAPASRPTPPPCARCSYGAHPPRFPVPSSAARSARGPARPLHRSKTHPRRIPPRCRLRGRQGTMPTEFPLRRRCVGGECGQPRERRGARRRPLQQAPAQSARALEPIAGEGGRQS